MDSQLEMVRKVYDLTVEQYRQGINPLDSVPEEVKNSPGCIALMADKGALGSAAPDIKEYLAPEHGMRFLDVGCSANLVNYRLDRWPSTYYGVDISPRLVEAMKAFARREQIPVGELEVAEVSSLPFEDSFFDIAAVIGVLEYCTLDYIRGALQELNRVLKPDSRVVLDIPNRNHPYAKDMARLEKHLARPNFLHSRSKFERLLKPLFLTERIDDSRVMIKYFVRTVK
ncbi:MAG: class I SAM-dependent methyltransferase [Chloroflexota bacterium]